MSKVSDFDELADCMVTALRLQPDHEKGAPGATSVGTGADLKKP